MAKEIDLEKAQLADMVKRLRAFANLTQRDLSRITGICQSDICKIERGMANPSLSTVAKIMEATGTRLVVDYEVNADANSFLVESWGNVKQNIIEVSRESAVLVKKALKEDLDSMILFGSCARGENTEDSDVDIAILTKCDRHKVKKYDDCLVDIATEMMNRYKELVNFVCLPISEYIEKKDWYPLFMNIEREGIVIYGRR